MSHTDLIEWLAAALELAGVAVVGLGLLLAAITALRHEQGRQARMQRVRHELGHAILLGLEILVAADIVRTVALTPTLSSVGLLALIVLIRSFLSWSLTLELHGRWPWQRDFAPAAGAPHRPSPHPSIPTGVTP